MNTYRAGIDAGRRRGAPRRTLADQAYQILREQIVWEEIEPDTRLGEAEVADELGFSRTPVRQALHRLESDGLLVRVGSRLSVAPFDVDVAVELIILRELLEPFAAEQSAPLLTPPDLARLRSILGEMEQALDHPEAAPRYSAELNIEFHSLLNSRCPFPRILDTIDAARDANVSLRLNVGYSRADVLRLHEEHTAIVETTVEVNAGTTPPERLGALIKDHLVSLRESLQRNQAALEAAAKPE